MCVKALNRFTNVSTVGCNGFYITEEKALRCRGALGIASELRLKAVRLQEVRTVTHWQALSEMSVSL